MCFSRCRWVVPLSAAALLAAGAGAQQPAQPPALPPINAGQARPAQTIAGLDGPGFAVAYGEEAGILFVACERGTIRYWHKDVLLGIRTGEGTPNVLVGHSGPVTGLAWNGGPFLASAGADQKVIIWNLADHKPQHTIAAKGIVRALAMSPLSKSTEPVLATAGDDPVIQLWNPETGKAGARLEAHTDWVQCLAFSADGKLLASGGHDGVVRLWDVTQAKKLLDITAAPAPAANAPATTPEVVLSLAFSPDGKLLAVGGSDTQIHLFNTADGKIVRSLVGHTSSVTALAFHASGTVVASGGKDSTVRLWAPTGAQLLKTLEGHTGWVQGLAFLAQGTRLASTGADQTVRLWDLTPQK
jgi:WD40 repeat protein